MRHRSTSGVRWFWGCAGACAVLAACWSLRWTIAPQPALRPPDVPSATAASHQQGTGATAPPVPPSRYLNATPSAAYVGTQVCAGCHPAEHKSYLRTTHSRAMGELRLDIEPPNAEFSHHPSGRTMTVFRTPAGLHHRQSLSDDSGETIAEEHVLKYAIGSGNHSRSYLAEIDGFLVESPLTWYAAKKGWDMSPGFDFSQHLGFERQADIGCLVCHAGRVETRQSSRDLVAIHEAAIGCENCHGAGSLHVERHRRIDRPRTIARGTGEEREDLTIVNPASLSREENEALCAQCHLRAAATVEVRGRRIENFRPGLRLDDFRVDYVSQESADQMTVVGHVEQMRASKCYQRSNAMTCTTCHDPHASVPAAERTDYFRARCNDCHLQACGLSEDERVRLRANDCVACHMPQRPTDLPHFAFTHHRIGLYTDDHVQEPRGETTSTLTPMSDLSGWSPGDRDRGLGLAYLEFSEKQTTQAGRSECRVRARRFLEAARQQGAGDAEVLAALARLALEANDPARAQRLAEDALSAEECGAGARTNALVVSAFSAFEQRNFPSALRALADLTSRRRRSEDWLLVGRTRGALGDLAGAAEALRNAAEIQPFRSDVRVLLAGTYARLGQTAEAAKESRVAAALDRQRPQK